MLSMSVEKNALNLTFDMSYFFLGILFKMSQILFIKFNFKQVFFLTDC